MPAERDAVGYHSIVVGDFLCLRCAPPEYREPGREVSSDDAYQVEAACEACGGLLAAPVEGQPGGRP